MGEDVNKGFANISGAEDKEDLFEPGVSGRIASVLKNVEQGLSWKGEGILDTLEVLGGVAS